MFSPADVGCRELQSARTSARRTDARNDYAGSGTRLAVNGGRSTRATIADSVDVLERERTVDEQVRDVSAGIGTKAKLPGAVDSLKEQRAGLRPALSGKGKSAVGVVLDSRSSCWRGPAASVAVHVPTVCPKDARGVQLR